MKSMAAMRDAKEGMEAAGAAVRPGPLPGAAGAWVAAMPTEKGGAVDMPPTVIGSCWLARTSGIPYVAVDSVVDDLERYFETLPRICQRPQAGSPSSLV